MFRRGDAAPQPVQLDGPTDEYSSSNIRMLLIAAAFLIVTIGLILLQPSTEIGSDVAVDVPATPVPTLDVEPASEVTRADASLLSIEAVSASEAVSRQLRQPIRLTDTDARHTDLRSLTAAVLTGFGHEVQPGDRLQTLLVQALTEGQSNAYIDALLNTAAARGEFVPPRGLTLATGRLDTPTLLVALVQQSQG